MARNSKKTSEGVAVKRVLPIVSAVVAVTLVLHLLRPLAQTLLLIFGGILLGVLLHGLADLLRSRISLRYGVALLIVISVLVGFFVAGAWFIGNPVIDQFAKLINRLPDSVENFESYLAQREWGQKLLSLAPSSQTATESAGTILQKLTDLFSLIFGGFGSVLIVLFIGIYSAVNPLPYVDGFVRLVPTHKVERTREVFAKLTHALRWWLLGQAVSMTVVGLLTAIGLLIVGMPLVLALALIAALLSFVPFIGPVLSSIPAILIALLESPKTALYVILVYAVVQGIESYTITPLVQKRAVSFPPAFLISVQILVGVLFGMIGVLMATPLAVVVVVLVQMLYIQDVLGHSVDVVGEKFEATSGELATK